MIKLTALLASVLKSKFYKLRVNSIELMIDYSTISEFVHCLLNVTSGKVLVENIELQKIHYWWVSSSESYWI